MTDTVSCCINNLKFACSVVSLLKIKKKVSVITLISKFFDNNFHAKKSEMLKINGFVKKNFTRLNKKVFHSPWNFYNFKHLISNPNYFSSLIHELFLLLHLCPFRHRTLFPCMFNFRFKYF